VSAGAIAMIYLLAFLAGMVAGLRTMTPPAMVAWAAHWGALSLGGTWLAFVGNVWARALLTLAALGELVTDQLPSTPSRKVPVQFGARLVSGAFCGVALAAGKQAPMIGAAVAGLAGAVIGTLGGSDLRSKLAAALGSDPPAAFIEDAIAIVGAVLIGVALR